MKQIVFSIVIHDPQGQVNVHTLGEGESIVGSDPGADICIPSESELLPRHFLLTPQRKECWVSAYGGAPLRTETGEALQSGFVPWGTRLYIGRTQIELQTSKIAPQKRKSTGLGNQEQQPVDTGGELATRTGVHPLLIMLVLGTIAFVAFGALSQATSSGTVLPPEEVELFSSEAMACTSANPGHRAELARDAAEAKSERSVFDLQDGVSAVSLYEEASACYRRAGDEARGTASLARASELREGLLTDYKRRRLRLERALAAGQEHVAAKEVRRLQELLRHQPNSATSLALRRLALRLARKN